MFNKDKKVIQIRPIDKPAQDKSGNDKNPAANSHDNKDSNQENAMRSEGGKN